MLAAGGAKLARVAAVDDGNSSGRDNGNSNNMAVAQVGDQINRESIDCI